MISLLIPRIEGMIAAVYPAHGGNCLEAIS
jgi:hypothetical protein